MSEFSFPQTQNLDFYTVHMLKKKKKSIDIKVEDFTDKFFMCISHVEKQTT